MAQLLAMHLDSYKCCFAQVKVGESSTFCQYNEYKHAVFIHKQKLQFSALCCVVLKDAAIKATASFTEEPSKV